MEAVVLAVGRRHRARPVRDAGRRAGWGTSSTRSSTARRRSCRGASRSTASTGSPQYPCAAYPVDTTFFQPLFLYESLSGVIGAITLLWIARRWGARLRPGDLFLLFLVWYAVVRLLLEMLRTGNWTFFGIPTAMVVSAIVIAFAIVVFAIRHRPGSGVERWGDPPTPDEDTYEADDEERSRSTTTRRTTSDDAVDAGEATSRDAADGGDDDEVDDEPGDRDGGGDAARPAPGT